jgi:para-nitrobenzyl esterase
MNYNIQTHKRRVRWLSCQLLAFAMLLSHAKADGPAVATALGEVAGLEQAGVVRFLGIPYAAPPVGARRFKPPAAAPAWSGVRDASRFAPHCPQRESVFGIASEQEDCLYLNVYAPASPSTEARPVMVWLHGGSLTYGQSDDWDPAALVQRGVVVITLNYRLGVLGYLAHPALSAEPDAVGAGNYGLLDQIAALRWVRENAAAFGGNPANVTIFGSSAGGLSVHALLASPLAEGLFHRAIAQSAAYDLLQPERALAEADGLRLAEAVGCKDAACLRATPVATLMQHQLERPTGYLPTVDGKVLEQSVEHAFRAGHFHKVPVIEGFNRDEFSLFVAMYVERFAGPLTAEGFAPTLTQSIGLSPEQTVRALTEFPLTAYDNPSLALTRAGTGPIFSCTARTAAQLLSRHVPTYVYEFADAQAPSIYLPPASFPFGAYHGAEQPYLFDVRGEVGTATLTPAQRPLAEAMVTYWTAFARTGDPSSTAAPAWPRFSEPRELVQHLAPAQVSATETIARDHHCAFWSALGR